MELRKTCGPSLHASAGRNGGCGGSAGGPSCLAPGLALAWPQATSAAAGPGGQAEPSQSYVTFGSGVFSEALLPPLLAEGYPSLPSVNPGPGAPLPCSSSVCGSPGRPGRALRCGGSSLRPHRPAAGEGPTRLPTRAPRLQSRGHSGPALRPLRATVCVGQAPPAEGVVTDQSACSVPGPAPGEPGGAAESTQRCWPWGELQRRRVSTQITSDRAPKRRRGLGGRRGWTGAGRVGREGLSEAPRP